MGPIHYWTFHTDNVKRGIIQVNLHSSTLNFNAQVNNIFNYFQTNGYSKRFIKKCVGDITSVISMRWKWGIISSLVFTVRLKKWGKQPLCLGCVYLVNWFHWYHMLGKLLSIRKTSGSVFGTKKMLFIVPLWMWVWIHW